MRMRRRRRFLLLFEMSFNLWIFVFSVLPGVPSYCDIPSKQAEATSVRWIGPPRRMKEEEWLETFAHLIARVAMDGATHWIGFTYIEIQLYIYTYSYIYCMRDRFWKRRGVGENVKGKHRQWCWCCRKGSGELRDGFVID